MDPAEQTKLLLEVSTLERKHEAHEADRIQREADEAEKTAMRWRRPIPLYDTIPIPNKRHDTPRVG